MLETKKLSHLKLVQAQLCTVSQALQQQKSASEAALKQCRGSSIHPYRPLPNVYQQHTAKLNASKRFINEQMNLRAAGYGVEVGQQTDALLADLCEQITMALTRKVSVSVVVISKQHKT